MIWEYCIVRDEHELKRLQAEGWTLLHSSPPLRHSSPTHHLRRHVPDAQAQLAEEERRTRRYRLRKEPPAEEH